LIFMLTGIGFLVPVMLVYNGYQYFVFSGKGRMKMAMPVSGIKNNWVKIIRPCPYCAVSPQRLTGSLALCPLPP